MRLRAYLETFLVNVLREGKQSFDGPGNMTGITGQIEGITDGHAVLIHPEELLVAFGYEHGIFGKFTHPYLELMRSGITAQRGG